jgi:hypothetical protein
MRGPGILTLSSRSGRSSSIETLFDAQSNEELPEQEYMKDDENDEEEDHDNEIWPNRQLSPTSLYCTSLWLWGNA